jgi:hypothetical protein
MPSQRTSRFLAERVEIEFHRRGNRFRRVTWLTGLAVAVICSGWIAWAMSRDQQTIYAAGPVASPHRFIEHDCKQCHTTWGLGQRLIAWDDTIRSVENEACVKCHAGPVHHANQVPAHEKLSCALCHHEHGGHDVKLVDVADQQCVTCHVDLQSPRGAMSSFAGQIERFSRDSLPGGHPAFALERLTGDKLQNHSPQPGAQHLVHALVGNIQRPGQPNPSWQDRAQIAFNHAKHLNVERNATGEIVSGLRGPDRQVIDLSRDNCSTCHQLDAERRYMQPIKYEKHCQACHPLLFDNLRFTGKTVPHGRPDLVRGFLTEQYANLVLNSGEPADAQPLKQVPKRPKPGERVGSPPNTNPTQTGTPVRQVDYGEQVRQLVAEAEKTALESVQPILGQMTRGGCRYCHVVNAVPGNPPWEIVRPNIPNRWLPHSVFSHDSHRFQKCDDCHSDVKKKSSTGDVMIPSIDVCFKCHSSDPSDRDPALRTAGARSHCVECHVYHHRP